MFVKKIKALVNRGVTEGAFRRKANADRFRKELKARGYRTGVVRSSGPTVEGGYKRNAYYVISEKMKKRARRAVKRRRPTGQYLQIGGMKFPY